MLASVKAFFDVSPPERPDNLCRQEQRDELRRIEEAVALNAKLAREAPMKSDDQRRKREVLRKWRLSESGIKPIGGTTPREVGENFDPLDPADQHLDEIASKSTAAAATAAVALKK